MAERVPSGDRELTELVATQAVAPGDDDTIDGGRGERDPFRAGLLGALGRQLLLKLPDLADEARHPFGQLGRADLERIGELAQLHLFVVDAGQRGVTGDGEDAPEVGADRSLAGDLDRTDEAERVHVRAAAQLDRVLPASSTRTRSPYLSPKNAIAPRLSACSLVVS